ncbi:TOBE domain-containing protein [Teredinibacter haidensis]|uniref:TOBE domain-containing protein n=1 Tax=Teredinibacter haidensis TaxID=2731755 RepID=UPI00094901BD|nr:molybdopterin-binding protein [Teredinibacter haidensis]
MKLSARNVIPGKVVRITQGAVNVDVVLEVAPGVQLVSIITKQACESLQLKEGMQAYAAIKATNVMIASE